MKRLALLVPIALLFAAACQKDANKNLVGPTLTGKAHIPSFATVQSANGATFTTDKDDYSPGETLNLSGSGWQAGDVLDVLLDETPRNHDPVSWTIAVDDGGAFTDASYVVQESDLGVTFAITATGRATGDVAQATFTDAPAGPGSLCADALGAGHSVCESPATTTTTTQNDTHYKQQVGTTATYQILGATDAVQGTNSCASGEVAVQIQSSDLGNSVVCGAIASGTITFTWTAPANGCNTTVVAYANSGDNGFSKADNDIIKDGADDGDSHSAAGIAYVDGSGNVVTDCGGGGGQAEVPTISKDAAGSYNNTYTWTIDKRVDKTLVQKIGGGNATFNYTVEVLHDGGAISNVQVTGTITVTNPNTAPVNITGVTDELSDNTSCVVTGGGTQIPAKVGTTDGSLTFSYTCGLSALPTGSLTNTATVSWLAQTVGTGSLAASSANITFPTTGSISFTPNDIDECVNVTDTYAGSLGSACVGDANPKSFTYERTIAVPANDCLNYDNTATYTTNDTPETDSDDQRVTVCGPARTGALTIGFWKGPNGNSLIQNYCGSLASYLSGLGAGSGPFADASGKSCSQLVTYVNGILTKASATNMNTMLKAQMLATALDVYFSGSGWTSIAVGKTKPPSTFFAASSPLGSFVMDLTAVCPMVDNLNTGTATCLNNTPSTNALTAGAVGSASLSVQAILIFAATPPSPFNGLTGTNSIWYSGNRTREEILKNIFDQINNQLAFAAP